jgi:hypothetical protein
MRNNLGSLSLMAAQNAFGVQSYRRLIRTKSMRLRMPTQKRNKVGHIAHLRDKRNRSWGSVVSPTCPTSASARNTMYIKYMITKAPTTAMKRVKKVVGISHFHSE